VKRRTAILTLGGLVASGGAAMGTGAFTSVEADRDFAVDVRNDDSAYLALRPVDADGNVVGNLSEGDTDRVPETPEQNRPFSLIDEDTGRIDIAVTALNADAMTVISNVFQIDNQGRNPIDVYVDISYEGEGDGNPDVVEVSTSNGNALDDDENPVELGDGNSLVVDLTFDTSGIGPDDAIADTITIHGTDPNRGESQ